MKQSTAIFLSTLAVSSKAFTIGIPKQSRIHTSIYSAEESDDTSLIVGAEISKGLQGLGSEDGYLGVAKKRNEEAKAKLMEQVRQEEEAAEQKRKEREARGNEGNYGPGDLSSFNGGGWGEVEEEEKQETEVEADADADDGPKLFLFGDDNADAGGLIL
jgi:hypothetical protein